MSSQSTAFILNDKKRDSNFLEGIATGTYFGVRSLIRLLATIVGLPEPVANLIAGVAASLFSESAKVEGRRRELIALQGLENTVKFDARLHKRDSIVIDRRLSIERELLILQGKETSIVKRQGEIYMIIN